MFRMILGYGKNHQFARKHPYELGFRHNQRYSLVNVKLKWVKDRVLDTVVTGERGLRAAWVIMSMIAVDPGGCLPIYRLSGRQRDAITLNQEAIHVFQENQKDVLERVCKLLMLTRDMILPIATIDQLKWDLGLPFDYVDSFIPNYKDVFSLIRLSDDRVALKLLSWPKKLAESQLETSAILQQIATNAILHPFRINCTHDFEHYACMADLLGRAGKLEDDFGLMCGMPENKTAGISKSDGDNAGAYVLLSKTYSSVGKYKDAANVRHMLSKKMNKKEAALDQDWGKVHAFIAGDESHSS
ncbi:hypothetical protein E3N88_08024 [Mikania micrantha]|uniref:PORR domain-containing protein n=1 Tax=Mikania micrantha TaxID=192012 RepID=A0A5N6PF28_9ASTR|nr:hypothetical protein E3N88_08024 [Mikania micrantha]